MLGFNFKSTYARLDRFVICNLAISSVLPQLRWDIWFTPTGKMCEGGSAGSVGGIGSRQRAIEVTLEAVPQIGLQLYIAAKKNAIGGLQVVVCENNV